MAICIECGKEFDVATPVRVKLSREYYKGIYDDQSPDGNICYSCAFLDISAVGGMAKTKSKIWVPVGTLTKKQESLFNPCRSGVPVLDVSFSSMILKLLIHFSINATGSLTTAAISSAFFPAYKQARPMRKISLSSFFSLLPLSFSFVKPALNSILGQNTMLIMRIKRRDYAAASCLKPVASIV